MQLVQILLPTGKTGLKNYTSLSYDKGTHNGGDERRWDSAHEQIFPVDVSEERLLLHVFGIALRCAQTSLRIFPQKLRK
jgi:hypothetical protein